MGHASTAVQADGRDGRDRFDDLRVFGLTDDGRLVRFRAGTPRKDRDLGYIWNLTATDTALVGIDFRVQDGKLYGVGNGGGVYTIECSTRCSSRRSSSGSAASLASASCTSRRCACCWRSSRATS